MDSKISVFRDAFQQEEFERKGYIVVPFLNQAEVKHLLDVYQQLYPQGVDGFFSTTFANNSCHRKRVNQGIQKTCKHRIDRLFSDHKILFSSFIVKAPGPESELGMHQDMTLVDESRFNGINIWCPLVDLTEDNGALQVLPGSHKLHRTLRGATLPDIYDGLQESIKPLMTTCTIKAGEAIIFDQSIIHYSPANLSNETRPVINSFVTHLDAKIQICYHDKQQHPGQVEIFEQDDDFLENFEQFGSNIRKRPAIGKSLGLVDYDFPKLSEKDLTQFYGSPQSMLDISPQEKAPLFQSSQFQEKLNSCGYAIIPLLSPEELQKLQAIYKRFFPVTPAAFFSSSYLDDFERKKAISDEITSVLRGKLGQFFQDYRSLGAAFLTKAPGEQSELPMHQDWSIVDERQHVALNVWIPLTPLSNKNGTLQVLPGSHRTLNTLRAPTLPFIGEGKQDVLKHCMVPLVVAPGEAVVLDQAVIHYSDANRSSEDRIAVTSGLVSGKAPLHFHFWDKEAGELETFQQEDDFLLRFENFHQSIFERPTMGVSIDKRPYQPEKLSVEEIESRLPNPCVHSPKSPGLFARLLKMMHR